MADGNQFEQILQELIQKALELRTSWEQRRSEVEKQIEILDTKLAAYQTTLKDYWESIDKVEIMKS